MLGPSGQRPLAQPRCLAEQCETYCCFIADLPFLPDVTTTPRLPDDPCHDGHDGADCVTPPPSLVPPIKPQPDVIPYHPNDTPKDPPYQVIDYDSPNAGYSAVSDDGMLAKRRRRRRRRRHTGLYGRCSLSLLVIFCDMSWCTCSN